MRFVPPEIIDEIKDKTDIVEVISNYVNLKRQGKNFVGLCPFHLEDTPSFTVSPDKQIYYCFGCQKGGGAINFLMDQQNLTFPEAAIKLAEKAGVEIPQNNISFAAQERHTEKERLIKLHELAATFYQDIIFAGKEGQLANKYLKKRQITVNTVKEFQLGYAPLSWDSLIKYLFKHNFTLAEMEKAGLVAKGKKGKFYDKFRGRLMFPIKDYRGRVIAFGGRVLGDELPKYLNSPETLIFNKSHNLYGLDLAASSIRRLDEGIIMEGYMDVITAHQYGITNAIASLGTAFTAEQGKLLKRYTSKVLIAYDADTAGNKATLRSLEILQGLGFRVQVLEFPKGLDPDDFLRKNNYEAWLELVQNKALSLIEYKLKKALDEHNILTIQGKTDVVQTLLPDLKKVKSQVEKDQYIRKIAQKLEIPMDAIYGDLRQNQRITEKRDIFTNKIHTNRKPVIRSHIQGNYRSKAQEMTEQHLCCLMIEERKFFDLVEDALGLDFSEEEMISRVLCFIKEIYEYYDWQVSTLVERIDQPDLQQFVSRLLISDLPDYGDQEILIKDYIKNIKLYRLDKKMDEIDNQIKLSEHQQINTTTMELLEKYSQLQKEAQELKK